MNRPGARGEGGETPPLRDLAEKDGFQVRSVAVAVQTAAADSARVHGELRAYKRLPPKRCLPDVAVLKDKGTAKDYYGWWGKGRLPRRFVTQRPGPAAKETEYT